MVPREGPASVRPAVPASPTAESVGREPASFVVPPPGGPSPTGPWSRELGVDPSPKVTAPLDPDALLSPSLPPDEAPPSWSSIDAPPPIASPQPIMATTTVAPKGSFHAVFTGTRPPLPVSKPKAVQVRDMSHTGSPRRGASAYTESRAARGLRCAARSTRRRVALAQAALARMAGRAGEQQTAAATVVVVRLLVDARPVTEGKPAVAGKTASTARARRGGVCDPC